MVTGPNLHDDVERAENARDVCANIQLQRFFDGFLESDVSPQALCRQVAARTGTSAGIRDRAGVCYAASPEGDLIPAVPPADARHRTLTGGENVWVASGNLSPETEYHILENFAITAKVSLIRGSQQSPAYLMRVAINVNAPSTERQRALRELGIAPSSSIWLLAVAGPHGGRGRIVEQVREHHPDALAAEVGRLTAVMVNEACDPMTLNVPTGNHVGVSALLPAREAPEAWRGAKLTLRFTQPSTHDSGPYSLVEASLLCMQRLNAYTILAESLQAEKIAEIGDVQRLQSLIRADGVEMLTTLDYIAATDSLREAGRQLHAHHSTVVARLSRAERALGYQLTDVYGRNRLFLSLMLRRLCESMDLV
ncbi:helix-turn-helix domain-containing protein [Arthrobacter sp. W4I7]|uniref:helix-turn-helix domain-containing protein n=1 Tax=Arthrobacter sp. W4I7 TaxID=3042296 RepID=UPI002780EFBA|nr:helix-turn-helix domain-containing protein [Arthrobacter sp. W4I7]MDQ0691422.1 hypothetical protein [Arthrobacter sp. W4I7]